MTRLSKISLPNVATSLADSSRQERPSGYVMLVDLSAWDSNRSLANTTSI